MTYMATRAIFVVGVEHSGTTILYRMLARHPDLAWLSHYSMRDGEIPNRCRVPFFSLINRLGASLFQTTWRKDFDIITTFMPNPQEGNGIWDHFLPNTKKYLTEEDYTDDVARRISSFFEKECQAWNKNRLLIKLPRLNRAVLLLNRVFPDANFIHIIRDGKAVALSNEHKFRSSPWGAPVALRESAEYWKEIVLHLQGAGAHIGDRFTTIKYENLCQDVRAVVSSIMQSVGLTEAKDVLRELPDKLSITNQRQYSKCSPDEMKLLNEVLEPTLTEYGYSSFVIR